MAMQLRENMNKAGVAAYLLLGFKVGRVRKLGDGGHRC